MLPYIAPPTKRIRNLANRPNNFQFPNVGGSGLPLKPPLNLEPHRPRREILGPMVPGHIVSGIVPSAPKRAGSHDGEQARQLEKTSKTRRCCVYPKATSRGSRHGNANNQASPMFFCSGHVGVAPHVNSNEREGQEQRRGMPSPTGPPRNTQPRHHCDSVFPCQRCHIRSKGSRKKEKKKKSRPALRTEPASVTSRCEVWVPRGPPVCNTGSSAKRFECIVTNVVWSKNRDPTTEH